MYFLTQKIMNVVATLMSILMCFTQTSGCTSEPVKDPPKKLVYELPSEWTFYPDGGGAIIGDINTSIPGAIPEAKIVVNYRNPNFYKNSRDAAFAYLNREKNEEFSPFFLEKNIAEKKVYIIKTQDYWNGHSEYAMAYLEEDGIILEVLLYGNLEKHFNAIEMLVKTIHWE